MLLGSDLRILSALDTPTSITALSEITGYSVSYVSERITRLQELELVAVTREGRSKKVSTFPTAVFETYKDLASRHSHIDLPSLISPSMLQICWFLDRPTSVSDIKTKLNLRRRRIYQLLEKLQSRGFITKQNNNYLITDRMNGLVRFAKTVIKYVHQHRAETRIPGSRVVWSSPHESLVIPTKKNIEDILDQPDWYFTGIQRFSDYGLDFFTPKAAYFHSEIKDTLTPSDLISHTLMVEADTRNLSYCALLMISEDVSSERLKEASVYYDIEETVDALITFVETKGETTPGDLPEWREFESLAEQYEVSL
ncbi:MAG: winged helix-turn-helix transcriptional regulator [Candidatus Thermoplasmatota archaeon]|nr:winged helix-turn-helix transcriptional regulator [Candidatus Thermoplasmatota archaeon]